MSSSNPGGSKVNDGSSNHITEGNRADSNPKRPSNNQFVTANAQAFGNFPIHFQGTGFPNPPDIQSLQNALLTMQRGNLNMPGGLSLIQQLGLQVLGKSLDVKSNEQPASMPASMPAPAPAPAMPQVSTSAALSVTKQPFKAEEDQANTTTNNTSTENKPDYIMIVPCKARGMPKDHNEKTAYLKIPRGVRHKEDLLCSHQGCRDDGVKFCYCAHCGVPVAKRNFRMRHDHGLSDLQCGPANASAQKEDETSKSRIEAAAAAAHVGSRGRQRGHSSDPKAFSSAGAASSSKRKKLNKTGISSSTSSTTGSSSTSFSSSNDTSGAAQAPKRKRGRRRSSDVRSSKRRKNRHDVTDHEHEHKGDKSLHRAIDKKRQLLWRVLLEERPASDDDETMSLWLSRVMEVSDHKQPLSAAPKPMRMLGLASSSSPTEEDIEDDDTGGSVS